MTAEIDMDVTHTSHEFKMFPIFNKYERLHRDKFNKFLLDTRKNYEQFKNFFAMELDKIYIFAYYYNNSQELEQRHVFCLS